MQERNCPYKTFLKGVWVRAGLDGLFVAIGHRPNTAIFKNWLEMDERGSLKVSNERPGNSAVIS
ncbi:MAG: hypothetical protein HXX08_15410 [Chloroflexi bacterium]|uniref:Uncharacterized protein n=1 Tax=Candidatus Chlorohelix allophototropha TaxID=3003348 RepID=A0A8T7M5C4_9CHLR|nr:hypothetical protein [Chloroflexota bacterium]WJW69167.1 hypothetical protein OZ401_002763 [Chloroflexota bacterium L227-S17]